MLPNEIPSTSKIDGRPAPAGSHPAGRASSTGAAQGRLQGKVAMVTGAAQGIGAATARLLAQEGAQVVLTDIDAHLGEAVAREIGGIFVQHDIASADDWKRAMATTAARHGGLDVLVNNAAIRIVGPLAQTKPEDFRRVMQVNVEGVFLGIQHALPLMLERARGRTAGGSIINLSSVLGIKGSVNNIAYGTSKGAVRQLTKCAAIEFAQLGYNIRVNSVHPAATDTAMVPGPDATAERAALAARVPLGRIGTPGDVARMVLFLASDDCGFTTGAEFAVDGGRLAA